MKEPTLDERITLLGKVPREIYEHDRGIGDSLELVLGTENGFLVANLFNHNRSKRSRESDEPRLKPSFIIADSQKTQLDNVYQKMVSALVQGGYFVEEKDQRTILIQPLATSADYVNKVVDIFIEQLKEIRSPLLERPRLDNSEHAYKTWLEKYHAENSMPLPPHFYKLDKKGLQGMFYGITDPSKIEKRLRERQFVAEFYKAHSAALPNDFNKWGHKKVEILYKRLVSWYGNGQPQNGTAQLQLFT